MAPSTAASGSGDEGRARLAPPRPLYPQLKPHPKGPARELIASNQRARIYGAMIEAVAEHGYAGSSVAKVIALAGVSRSTFYEQFADRQACFMATFEIVVARAIKRIDAAYRGEGDWLARIEGAFDAFAREVAEHPKAARLAIVEALGAGPQALQSMERARGAFERIAASSFERSPSGVRLPPTVIMGIVGAIARVTRARLTEDRVEELPAFAGDLRAWMPAYDSPAVQRLRVEAPADRSRPQRSAHAWSAAEDERTRILLAAADLAARGGYASLSAGRIARGAGVSHERFRAHFHSTEECFLAACDLIGERSLAAIFEASLPARDWPDAVCRAGAAVLGLAASDRVFARLVFVEIFAAGPAGLPSRTRLMDRGAALLREHAPASERVSEIAAEAIVGGVYEIVHHHVVRDQARLLPGLTEHTAYFALAPAIGADAAVQHILAARESAALPGGARACTPPAPQRS